MPEPAGAVRRNALINRGVPQAGPPVADFPQSTAGVLDRALAECPDREALVTDTGRLTYRELDRLANQAAHALAEDGHRRGETLGVCLPNESEIVVAFHGAMRCGAVWVGINKPLAPPEKAYILRDASVTTLLCDQATKDELAAFRSELPALRRILVAGGDADADSWQARVRQAPATSPGRPNDPYAAAAIAYTSGTTGFPKGVVHSDYNLLLPGAAIVADRGYAPGYRKGDFLPLTILNMIVLTTLLTAQAKGCAIITGRRDPAYLCEWLARERIETFTAPAAIYQGMANLAEARPRHFASTSELFYGGAGCPESLRARFRDRFRVELLGSYGLTEAPSGVAMDPPGGHRPGASGRAYPHLDLYAVNDAGTRLPAGEEGEICVSAATSGPWAGTYVPMLGYLGKPEATQQALHDGRLRTGDIGSVNRDGYVTITDRKNAMILRGGTNVYPAEVERVLTSHPSVLAAAVIGIPDERLGERVVAVVQLDPPGSVTDEELKALCRLSLARYKVPEQVRFTDNMPRNSMGKVLRPSLLTLFADSRP